MELRAGLTVIQLKLLIHNILIMPEEVLREIGHALFDLFLNAYTNLLAKQGNSLVAC